MDEGRKGKRKGKGKAGKAGKGGKEKESHLHFTCLARKGNQCTCQVNCLLMRKTGERDTLWRKGRAKEGIAEGKDTETERTKGRGRREAWSVLVKCVREGVKHLSVSEALFMKRLF